MFMIHTILPSFLAICVLNKCGLRNKKGFSRKSKKKPNIDISNKKRGWCLGGTKVSNKKSIFTGVPVVCMMYTTVDLPSGSMYMVLFISTKKSSADIPS